MRVLIVGAGIAGPVLGSFLSKAGIESVLCEGRPEPAGEEGGFLGVAPNGMRVLAEIGLDRAVEEVGVVCEGFTFHNAKGKRVGIIDRRRDRADLGVRMVMTKRSALHRVLSAHARGRGVPIRYGARLVALDRSNPSVVTARFEDGHEERADMVVGCDGLRSRVRSLVFPTAPEPAFTGLLDFGGYARLDEPALEVGWNVMVFGKRAFFGAFRAPADERGRSEVWWFHNGGDVTATRSMPPTDRRRRILELHAGDPSWITDCVEATTDILGPWPLHEVCTLDRWHVGRVGLIGDAAHATSPSAGQGASLAIEDAMMLARCLRDARDPDVAFAQLEALRRERVAEVVRQSRRNSSAKALGPVAAWLRDQVLPTFIRLGEKAQREAYAYRIDWAAPAAPASSSMVNGGGV